VQASKPDADDGLRGVFDIDEWKYTWSGAVNGYRPLAVNGKVLGVRRGACQADPCRSPAPHPASGCPNRQHGLERLQDGPSRWPSGSVVTRLAIVVEGLPKRYGQVIALDELSAPGKRGTGATEGVLACCRIVMGLFQPHRPGRLRVGLPRTTRAGAETPRPHPAAGIQGLAKEDGSPTPAYRLLDLYFADYAAASAAAAEAGELVTATLKHATGDVVIAFAETLEDV
jgi:hypothetical protein